MLKSKKGYIYPFIMQSNVCMSQKDNVGWMNDWLADWLNDCCYNFWKVATAGCCIMKKSFQEDVDDDDGLLMD